MGRLEAKLSELARCGRRALVPFVSAGDPDMETTRHVVLSLAEAGADMVELGVPFSDPVADGSVIQASSQRALAAGASLPGVLRLVAELRRQTEVPIILFGYYNPFFRYGVERFTADAKTAGADAVLCVDLPPEEADDLVAGCEAAGLDRIFLLAPTSDDARIDAVARLATGFVYFVAVTGVTGARSELPLGIQPKVARVRERCGLPVGVGFGISNAAQAARVGSYADLVVVGSALVETIHAAGARAAPAAAAAFVAALRAGLDGGGGA